MKKRALKRTKVRPLIHCTEPTCGRMFNKGKKCPTCGSTNVRPNVKEGTIIMMTVHTAS